MNSVLRSPGLSRISPYRDSRQRSQGARWPKVRQGLRRAVRRARRQQASLSISDGADGRLLWHCHAGCEQEAVRDAMAARGLLNGHARDVRADFAIKGLGVPSQVWTYRDPAGGELLKVCRYDTAARKEMRPWRPNGGGWECKSLPAPRPLYGLDLLASRFANPVLVVEGEKCADAAGKLLGDRFVCTTWPGGADSVHKADWSPLHGRKVTVWPDADQPGADAATAIVASLRRIAGSVAVLNVADKPKGWDVADALAEGWTPEDARTFVEDRSRPQDAVAEVALPKPVVVGGCLELAQSMADLEYVLYPLLVQGQVITNTAHPGHGKSTTGTAMAVSLALQQPCGRLRPRSTGLVYFVSAEDLEGTRLRILAEAATRKLTDEQRALLNRQLRWVQLNTIVAPQIIREYIEQDAAAADVAAVFLDTGPAMFNGEDENSNTEMQSFATQCRVLTTLPGRPCVVIFWHPAKGATADNLLPRGGSALLGAIDGNLTLWHDADSGVATLARSPSKWRGEHFEPLYFRFEGVSLVLASGRERTIKVAVPADATAAAPAKAKPVRRDVALEALREMIAESGEARPEARGAKSTTLEQWRARWALRTGYAESSPDSIRANFNKDKDGLLSSGKVSISAPFVWLA